MLTNPPFYTSESELESLAKQKSRPPNSACTGAPIEMIYPGGEIAFVGQLIKESKLSQNRLRIQWFSSMLGKLGSVSVIVDALRAEGCTNYAVTELVQGQKTRRWCIAWSWFSLRPSQKVARGTDAIEKKNLPFPTELQILMHSAVQIIPKTVNKELSTLDNLKFEWLPDSDSFIGISRAGDVWSRHARRKMKKLGTKSTDAMNIDRPVHSITDNALAAEDSWQQNDHGEEVDRDDSFVFSIHCKTPVSERLMDSSSDDTAVLTLRWLQGQDSKVFESFHGWLKRRLTT